jgi:hypothetical protein
MSALAKPMVVTTNTIAPADPVNVELLTSFTKVDKPQINDIPAEYWIVFKLRGDNTSPSEVVWRYDDSADRNTDYASVITYAAEDIS